MDAGMHLIGQSKEVGQLRAKVAVQIPMAVKREP